MTRHERRELQRQQRKGQAANQGRRRTFSRALTWAAVVIVLGGAVAGLVALANKSTPTGAVDPVTDQDWTKGPKDAKTVLIEYSDLQCPACRAYLPTLKSLAEKNADKLLVVYRHFPLKQTHRNAELAARFAQAAGKQGKFWEMHDVLFEKQTEWSSEGDPKKLFIEYAASLGLNTDQLTQDADSATIKQEVEGQYQSGLRAGVDATPTFFLNGTRVKNPASPDDFANTVNAAIAAP